MPYIPRTLLVKGIIVPFRAPEERSGLQVDLGKEGSPIDCTYQTVAASIAAAF